MKKIKLLIFTLFLLGSVNIYSQIGVTSYSIHAFGVHTSKERQISGELRAFFNRGNYTAFELVAMYNFQDRDFHRFSVGLGFDIHSLSHNVYVDAFVLPVQLEIFPLQNFRQLSLVMELAPRWDIDFRYFFEIRHLWGIRYTFNRR